MESFWILLETEYDFYAYLNGVKENLKEKFPDLSDQELAYYTNIEAGTEIEKRFNEKYYKLEIEVENFSQREAYHTGISPFKKALSNKFEKYQIKTEMKEEFEKFKKVLNKAQIILTTNYDTFIEDSYNDINPNVIKKYIGQKGFFEQAYGWAEIYKIHGSVDDPQSIIISKGVDGIHLFRQRGL